MYDDNQYITWNGFLIAGYVIYLIFLKNISDGWEKIWDSSNNLFSKIGTILGDGGSSFYLVVFLSIVIIAATIFIIYKNITDFYNVSPILRIITTVIYLFLTVIHIIFLDNPVLRILFVLIIIALFVFAALSDN